MTSQTNSIEQFSDLWSLGDPVVIEREFLKLLPQAKINNNKSLYPEILSQIALTQALQKKFEEAHNTLNEAEQLLTPDLIHARIRILLERGEHMSRSKAQTS